MRFAAVAAVVGGLLGGGLAVVMPAPMVETVVPSQRGGDGADSGCSTARGALEARIALVEARRSELLRRQSEEGYRVRHPIGERIPWPTDPPDRLRAGAFRATLDEAAARVGAEIVLVECGEYPCLAVVRAPPTLDGPFARAVDGTYRRFYIAEHSEALADGDRLEAVLFYPKPWAGTPLVERVQFRAASTVAWQAELAP